MWVACAISMFMAHELFIKMLLLLDLSSPCSVWIWIHYSGVRYSSIVPWALNGHRFVGHLGSVGWWQRVLFIHRYYRILYLAFIIMLFDAYHLYMLIRCINMNFLIISYLKSILLSLFVVSYHLIHYFCYIFVLYLLMKCTNFDSKYQLTNLATTLRRLV